MEGVKQYKTIYLKSILQLNPSSLSSLAQTISPSPVIHQARLLL